jgi:hypothetical protein
MLSTPDWTESGINYGNQPANDSSLPAPVVGAIANTTQGISYQIGLHEATLQQAAGGQLSLLIDSQSADELVIQSRNWLCFPPKLIVYYSTGVAAPSTATVTAIVTATESDGPPAEGAAMFEDAALTHPDGLSENPSTWTGDDSNASCPYINPGETDQDVNLYLPSLAQ